MTRQEIQNNTPEQIRDYLLAAAQLVGELELPDDLRVAAFEQAVGLFAGKQILMQPRESLSLGHIGFPGGRH